MHPYEKIFQKQIRSHYRTQSPMTSKQLSSARTECFSPLRICTCDFPLTLTKSRLKRIKICSVIIGREACRGRERSHGSAQSLVCVIIRFVCSDSLLVYWWKTKSKQPFHRGTWQLFFFSFTKDILLETKGI